MKVKKRSGPEPHGLELGAIGNGRVLALVDREGSIVWWCAPRFDSPSIFGKLLDEERGGSFQIRSASKPRRQQWSYLPNTNCLRTQIETGDGAFEIIDFAPWLSHAHRPDNVLEIHRLVRPLRGSPRIVVRFDPRPDYGAVKPSLVPFPFGLEAKGGGPSLFLTMNAPSASVLAQAPILLDRARHFTLSYGRPSACKRPDETAQRLEETTWLWRSWVKGIALPGFAASSVIRSALALRLHMYDDTGAIIAAATTSIPEAMGSGRNWDYRYCWLRDAAFVAEAFSRIGLLFEGERFLDFLRNIASGSKRLQPVYALAGEADLPERTISTLRGYLGSGPVRVGNAAALQRQNDVYGEMLLALSPFLTDPRIVRDDRDEIFRLVRGLVERARRGVSELDTGIWEFRSLLRHYTHSKAMCWVALDRGAKLAAIEGKRSLARSWRAQAERVRAMILRRGYNAKLGFFTQGLDGTNPDASLLLLGRFGLLAPDDPRWISTLRQYEKRLVRRGIMLRYANEDDFGETTSGFLLCSFWWVEALARRGEIEKAKDVFHFLLSRANSLGLFSEDVDPESGMRLGNFPQAYTHVGVIEAALAIAQASR